MKNKEILSEWELKEKLSEIIEDNITEIPYEGKEIDKESIVEEIYELIKKISLKSK